MAILDAARALFEVDGYHAVGLEAVAAKAGVSRQAIYLHFESKAALLADLHRRINEQDVAPNIEKIWAQPDARAGLAQFVAAHLDTVPGMYRIFVALDAARRVDPDVEASWEPGVESRYSDCTRMAKWLKDEGELATGVTVRFAADVLFGLLSVDTYELFIMQRQWSTRRWTDFANRVLDATILRAA